MESSAVPFLNDRQQPAAICEFVVVSATDMCCYRNWGSAIDADPQNAVCLSNRAAAYLKVRHFVCTSLRFYCISRRERVIDYGKSSFVYVIDPPQLHDYRNAIEDCSQAIDITPSIKVGLYKEQQKC